MEISIFRIISDRYCFFAFLVCMLGFGCRSSIDAYDQVYKATITYPFYLETEKIGNDAKQERLIIRTTSGNTEYTVEIPENVQDYDIEVPIADIGKSSEVPVSEKNVQISDRELVANMPRLSREAEEQKALMDKALGVSESGGPRQSPSYLLSIQRINESYKKMQYESALIEINNLLVFYPTSVKLLKMKGTILIKLGSLELARKAWIRAESLAPNDPLVKRGITKLTDEIDRNKRISMTIDDKKLEKK